MSFIVIIPARLESTRLPGKPLADIGGLPMIVRVAQRAAQSAASRVIVATDHADILAACDRHQIEARLTRIDHASGTERIAEVALALQLADDAVIVNLQGDEPLIDPQLIDATAARIQDAVPMATAAHPITTIDDIFNPNVVKVVIDRHGRALYFSRAPIPWDRTAYADPAQPKPSAALPLRHIGLYAFQNRLLQTYAALEPSPLEKIEALEQLRVLWHGIALAVHLTPAAPAAGVDTPEDLERVRRHFANLQPRLE